MRIFAFGKKRVKDAFFKERFLVATSIIATLVLCLFLSLGGRYYDAVLLLCGQEAAQTYVELRARAISYLGGLFRETLYAIIFSTWFIAFYNFGKPVCCIFEEGKFFLRKEEYVISQKDDFDDEEDEAVKEQPKIVTSVLCLPPRSTPRQTIVRTETVRLP